MNRMRRICGMKWTNRAIRYGLAVMILLSLFLSWKIWTSPRSIQEDKNVSGNNVVIQEKSPSDVFLPTSFILHRSNQSLHSTRESTIASIMKEISHMDFSDVSLISSKDEEQYYEIQKKDNSLEMVYPDTFSFTYFTDIFQGKTKEDANNKLLFNRFIFSFNDGRVYFMNDRDYDIYEVNEEIDLKKIKQILSHKNQHYLKVSNRHEWLPHQYYLDEPIELKKYSYILASQSYTTFSQAFFANTDDLYSQDERDKLHLSNPENESLTLNYQTHEVQFVGRNQSEHEKKSTNLYRESFYYVGRLGNAFGPIRYFNKSGTSIIYKNFVEGFPVIGDYYRGKIKVTIMSLNNLEIKTNQETIQIPIPSDKQVTLPNTEEVVQSLSDQGFPMEEIQSIQIGYTWKSNSEVSQVVDLTPEWYVRKDNEWKTIDEWLAQ